MAIWALIVLYLRAFKIFFNKTYNCITVALKFAGRAGPLSVNFEGPQAILRTIGPRVCLILTLDLSQPFQISMNCYGINFNSKALRTERRHHASNIFTNKKTRSVCLSVCPAIRFAVR